MISIASDFVKSKSDSYFSVSMTSEGEVHWTIAEVPCTYPVCLFTYLGSQLLVREC